jgi:hypothetical protein
MAVLEPGAGFGSWRALFGWRRERRAQSWTETKDVEHVITVAPASSQAASPEENANQIEQISSNLTMIEHD